MSNRSLKQDSSQCITYTTFWGFRRAYLAYASVGAVSVPLLQPRHELQGCILDWFHGVEFKPGFQVLGVRDDFRNLYCNPRDATQVPKVISNSQHLEPW